MPPGPSLKSVALAAGVSVSSVSNAYNKPEQLSADVRARILEVAKAQGYAGPDAAAVTLSHDELVDRLKEQFDAKEVFDDAAPNGDA